METLSFAWWLWALVGLLLLAGELLTPGGFYLIFFGAGALAVGLLKLLLGIQVGLAMEGLVFVVISVAALALFRKPLLQRFQRLSPPATSTISPVRSPRRWRIFPPEAEVRRNCAALPGTRKIWATRP